MFPILQPIVFADGDKIWQGYGGMLCVQEQPTGVLVGDGRRGILIGWRQLPEVVQMIHGGIQSSPAKNALYSVWYYKETHGVCMHVDFGATEDLLLLPLSIWAKDQTKVTQWQGAAAAVVSKSPPSPQLLCHLEEPLQAGVACWDNVCRWLMTRYQQQLLGTPSPTSSLPTTLWGPRSRHD